MSGEWQTYLATNGWVVLDKDSQLPVLITKDDSADEMVRSLVEAHNKAIQAAAGDRPVPPTRDQLFETIAHAVTLSGKSHVLSFDIDRAVTAVTELLSGGVPTEPARPSSGCPYVFGPYSCVKRAGHDGEHLGSTTGEWVPTEEDTHDEP